MPPRGDGMGMTDSADRLALVVVCGFCGELDLGVCLVEEGLGFGGVAVHVELVGRLGVAEAADGLLDEMLGGVQVGVAAAYVDAGVLCDEGSAEGEDSRGGSGGDECFELHWFPP